MNDTHHPGIGVRMPKRRLVCLAAGTLMMSQPMIAAAQLIEPGPLPGAYTALQRPVANGIFRTCRNLIGGLGVKPVATGSPTERLANACSLMVHTARLANGLAGGNPSFDLRLSNTELATAIQAIAPVQANAQKQISTEALKMNAIGARLLNLRGGARGMVLAMNGQDIQTGGGAAADDVLGGPWGSFVNVTYNWGDVDKTILQDAYKQDSYNVVAGADYRVGDTLVLGAAISYGDTTAKYEQGLGRVKAKTTGVVGYGTYYVGSWYVDGLLSYGDTDFESRRNITIASRNPALPGIATAATSSPKGDQWSASIGAGKDFRSEKFTVTPSARLSYIHVDNKAFAETEPVAGLGLSVDGRGIESLQSSLGARFSTTVNTAAGVLVPYASVQWVHEFKKDNPSLVSRYVNDPNGLAFAIPTASPDSNYGVVAIGTSMTMPNNLSAFAQFSSAVGLKDENSYAFSAGLRIQF